MKVRVTTLFRDINDTSVAHLPGDVVEFDSARARTIIGLGLGVEVRPAKPKTKKIEDDE